MVEALWVDPQAGDTQEVRNDLLSQNRQVEVCRSTQLSCPDGMSMLQIRFECSRRAREAHEIELSRSYPGIQKSLEGLLYATLFNINYIKYSKCPVESHQGVRSLPVPARARRSEKPASQRHSTPSNLQSSRTPHKSRFSSIDWAKSMTMRKTLERGLIWTTDPQKGAKSI